MARLRAELAQVNGVQGLDLDLGRNGATMPNAGQDARRFVFAFGGRP